MYIVKRSGAKTEPCGIPLGYLGMVQILTLQLAQYMNSYPNKIKPI